MDYFDILISVNKISIFFFVITVFFILYEFYLYNKEKGKNKDIPVKMPSLEEAPKLILNATPVKQLSDEKPPPIAKKPNNKFLLIGGIAIALFGLIFIVSYLFISRQQQEEELTKVLPTTKPSVTPKISPTQIPTPTVSDIIEEETVPASPSPTISLEEEIVVAEVSPTEAPVVEEEQIPAAGSAFYPLFIFAASVVLILVAFVL